MTVIACSPNGTPKLSTFKLNHILLSCYSTNPVCYVTNPAYYRTGSMLLSSIRFAFRIQCGLKGEFASLLDAAAFWLHPVVRNSPLNNSVGNSLSFFMHAYACIFSLCMLRNTFLIISEIHFTVNNVTFSITCN